MQRDDPAFLGRGWHFPPEFDASSGQSRMVDAEDDIRQSLSILFQTRPGERVMQPEYGCRIKDLVFETMNGQTISAIETAIREAVLYFEPRITLTQLHVGVDNWLEGHLSIAISYRVKETNSRSNIVFPFYISEGTLVLAGRASGD